MPKSLQHWDRIKKGESAKKVEDWKKGEDGEKRTKDEWRIKVKNTFSNKEFGKWNWYKKSGIDAIQKPQLQLSSIFEKNAEWI